jgi:hypothetical protein
MPKKERIRESLAGPPSQDYLMQRMQMGWRPSVIEWERDIVPPGAAGERYAEEIPYGLEVSTDCSGLVECASEKETITLALDMIVEDCPLSRVAAELNSRGMRTRAGSPWTPTDLFNLLPRMIQVGPRLFSSEQWMSRRERLPKVV